MKQNYGESSRRWYDKDPILSKSMYTLEHSSDETQIKIALNLIKIIIEHNISNSKYKDIGDILTAVEDGKIPRGIDRWYDIDITVRTAINMLENCQFETQKQVAREMAALVVNKIKEDDSKYDNIDDLISDLVKNIDDEEEADEISELMCDDNSKRRQIEADELTEIENTIMQNPSFVNSRIIVIDGENWRQGVNGLVASKLKEAFGKPVIVISHGGDEAKGSARSVEGFPIHTAVAYCSDLLMHHGGHPMAAGLSLKTQNIDLFRKKINEFANSFENMPFDSLNISCKLNPAFINVDMINSLDYLKPYGAGNPTPLFGFYNMTVADIIPLANDKHLKLMLNRNGTTIEAMQFGMSTSTFPYNKGDVVDIAAKLDINEYNGYVKPSVIVQAIKFSSDDTVKILKSQRIFEDFCCGVKITKEEIFEILPNRNDFVLLYTYLRKNNGYNYPFVTLMHRLDNKLTYGKIRVILEALNELGLIKINEGVKESEIRVIPNPQKVNLESAEIIRKLKEMSL